MNGQNPSRTTRCDHSLTSLLGRAYGTDPCDVLISQVSEFEYSTLFGTIPIELAVLRLAARIEPVSQRLLDWYRHSPIAELGHLSADALVRMHRGAWVIDFLESILSGVRE
jgi:hypothetical protein